MKEFIKITYPTVTKPYNSWSDADLQTGTASIADAMDGNDYFTSIAPAVTAYKAQSSAFAAQLAKCASRDSDIIATKNVMRRDLILATIQLGTSAEQIANGDILVLLSAKFPLRKMPQPVIVGKPTGLTLTPGTNPGELLVRVDGMRKVSLVIEYTMDPLTADSQWDSVTCSTCSYLLTGLEPGKRYWVKVAAVGGNQQMVWGDTLQSPFIQG